MRRLVLSAFLGLLALPAAASAAPGTLTITASPDGHTLILTGTNEREGAYSTQEGVSAALGGGTGLTFIAENANTVIAPSPTLPANTCEASRYDGGIRCKAAGITKITADLKGTADYLDAGGLGGLAIDVDFNGGPGGDYLLGSSTGNDTLSGGDDNDTLLGNGGNDTINGDDGADRLLGQDGNDTINGGAGNDQQASGGGSLLAGGPGNDTMNGGPGNDELYGDEDQDTLAGDSGDDFLRGDAGNDALNGGDDNDALDGADGTDTYVGGPGTDSVSYQSFSPPGFGNTAATPGVRVTLDGAANDGPDSDFATAGIQGSTENVGADIEKVTGSNFADDLTGGPGNDTIDGTNGNDAIGGGAGNDTLSGGAGDDTFNAEPGADTYDGGYADTIDTLSYASRSAAQTISLDGAANDGQAGVDGAGVGGSGPAADNVSAAFSGQIIGGSGADTMNGGASNDNLNGGPGSDTIKGGSGGDLLNGGPGVVADTIDGEAGADTVDYSSRSANLNVDLGDPGTDGEAGEGDVLNNLEGIRGGSGNDTLKLAPAVSGDGPSLTTFRGVDGNGGNDTIAGTEGPDVLNGGPGTDTISGLGGPDRLIGGDGNDDLDGGNADDVLYGDAGYNSGGGNLDYNYSEGGAAPAGEGNDTLKGAGGNDTLIGGSGTDTLQAGADNDALYGGLGGDTVDGGLGTDSVTFEARSAGVTVTVDAGSGDDGNDVDGAAGQRDTFTSVENLTGTQQADAFTGNDSANTFKGRGGDDALRGMGGDDFLDGGDTGDGGNGADLLDGGPGLDTTTYGGSSWWSGAVNVSLDGVANDGRGDETADGRRDNVVAVEHLIGSQGADTFTGTDADEIFEGFDGADTINAAGGNDVILAGNGADTVNAGGGDDLIGTAYWDPRTPSYGVGDSARDTVDAGPGNDRLVANDRGGGAQGNVLKGGTGTDTLTYTGEYEPVRISEDGTANDGVINGGAGDNASEFEVLEGGSGADTITGGGGAQVLRGADGTDTINGGDAAERLEGGTADDVLNGGKGDDALDGGTGKDTLVGGEGLDTTTYADRTKAVKVTLDGTVTGNDGDPTIAGGGEKDKVDTENVTGGDGDDTLTGDGNANTLRGGPGADTIDGAAGDDLVDGSTGRDTLKSGAGADTLDALDGEADTLLCDTRAGKTVTADAGVDTVDSCADPASLSSAGSGTGSAPFTVAPLAGDPSQGSPAAGAPLSPFSTGVNGRTAGQLATAIKPKARGAAAKKTSSIAVGSAACAPNRTCGLTAQLLAGKKVVGSGALSGTGKLALTIRLTPAGFTAAKRRGGAKLTLRITLSEDGSQATILRPFTLTASGGAR